MSTQSCATFVCLLRSLTGLVGLVTFATLAHAQTPTLTDPTLQVTTVVSGLTTPAALEFIGPNDFLVTEKNTGRVKRVTNGTIAGVVLDLAVNFANERGLLGIALHPNFPTNPGVYLYWTQSSTGADSNVLAEVPLLGNRVDRFIWDGSTLTMDRNIIMLRSRQADATQTERANNNGGAIQFGPDGKVYIQYGEQGRRGWLQNLPTGPFIEGGPDDQFGGPEPDNAHVTGVIFRLNDDGTTPPDNPFFAAGASIGGEVGANIQKVFSYGHRNGFGLAFDPLSGNLWEEENGDDTFDEINRIIPGGNYGWIQIMGPLARIAQFKQLETTQFGGNLLQVRYPPTRLAYTGALALSRMFMLPGAQYVDPEFTWKYSVAPAGLGFVHGNGLGDGYAGTLWVGAATPRPNMGYLMVFRLSDDRSHLVFSDPRLSDHVADNVPSPGFPTGKFDPTESESLLIGSSFGISTDIHTGPDGNLYVVSVSTAAAPAMGAVYMISRLP
jgi:aldose sugar dehydrogenase